MTPFAGWEMPVQYASILDEARAVRSRAGIFDVSHMGRVDVRGPGAAAFLGRLLSFDVPGMRVGRARYGVICTEEGGIIDDCIAYRRGSERFLLIANASNTATVLAWLRRWSPSIAEVQIDDVTTETAMIAHQGPRAPEMLSELTPLDMSSVRPFRAVETQVAGAETLVARTGYTGEDGFELILPREAAARAWNLLLEKGAEPCGLGARDVLRLEAGLLLHGNDMDDTTNPYEAGLSRFVDPDRDGYVAGQALRRIRDRSASRVLVGFKMVDRGIARHGHPIVDGSSQIGRVTSGGYSPTLDSNIGLGYVPTGYSIPGSRFQIDVRGRRVEAEVTTLPFYSRRRSA
jgi:aminomethyltransferase